MATGTSPIERSNLASQIYEHLREQLMSATFQPGQRLKIRELAKTMGTSETPVREALIQLVRDHALEMKAGHFIRVRMLSLAAERAVPWLDDAALGQLGESHRLLMHAEKARDYRAALQHNFDFHFGIYRRSGMPQLTGLLDRIWMQVGPMMNFLYPHGHPHYDGVHQHLNVLPRLQTRDLN